MRTLGSSFAPWKDARAIADGPSILRYVQETAEHPGSPSLPGCSSCSSFICSRIPPRARRENLDGDRARSSRGILAAAGEPARTAGEEPVELGTDEAGHVALDLVAEASLHVGEVPVPVRK
jgi:hypothetical protein